MEASLPFQFPAVAFVGTLDSAPLTLTQPPNSHFAPGLTGFGLSSGMVFMKTGEVWTSPALGEKVGQGCPCLVLVGKSVWTHNRCAAFRVWAMQE